MKICTVCDERISAARLKALPNADKCITCASANDVVKIRRFDERVGEDTVENYYTGPDTPEIVRQRERLNDLTHAAWSTDSGALVMPFSEPEENVAVDALGDITDDAEDDEEGTEE